MAARRKGELPSVACARCIKAEPAPFHPACGPGCAGGPGRPLLGVVEAPSGSRPAPFFQSSKSLVLLLKIPLEWLWQRLLPQPSACAIKAHRNAAAVPMSRPDVAVALPAQIVRFRSQFPQQQEAVSRGGPRQIRAR